MEKISNFFKVYYKEIIAQLILYILLFLFYAYSFDDTEERTFLDKISFFTNYTMAAMIINYILLPRFYYKKRFALFFLTSIFIIVLIILIDEMVLEQIYFPETRGKYFPGIPFTLLETLPTIIVFVGFKLAWDFNKKQNEIEALKNLVRESELQFLKSQINPHFLFNNLNNLYVYAIEKSPKTPSIILELSSVLRYMLYDCRENFVALSKEITHLKNFTALNELQIENRGDIQFHSGNIPSQYTIAPLILTVFIENAFKHSTASQSDNIYIHIKINVSEIGELTFSCMNSFLPSTNTDDLAKGIGLSNVKKRLLLLYPNTHKLSIENTNNTFKVILKMQLKSKDL